MTNSPLVNLVAIVVGGIIGITIFETTKVRDHADDGKAAHKARYHETCTRARVGFFEECLKTVPRLQCEVMWAQLRGHVFEGRPDWSVMEEVDCSAEVK